MLRLAGACLVVLGGWGIGQAMIEAEVRRVREGEALLDLLRFIKTQIVNFCRPRAEIFAMYENVVLEERGFLTELRESTRIETALSHLSCSEETRELLCAFDRELGRSYRDSQAAACDYYIARLDTHLTACRTALPTRTRILRTVFMTGALMLTLLLL